MTNAPASASPEKEAIAAAAASILLEIKAVHFNAETPFIFTSGWASPVYTDCRRIISFVNARRALTDFAVSTIQREAGYEAVDAVAGGETAGIPFAAWIADRMDLPMLYVRKKPKGFGRNAQIEGTFRDGDRVLLVEDLATDSKSKVNFVNALREAGAQVTDTFVFFHYGIFPQSEQTMASIGVRLHALCTWWDVLKVARAKGTFDENTLTTVEAFLNDPVGWSAAHGGKSSFD
ncbi:orotate phosphoribosyltransferase [Azospirillum sp. RWY-5-1]|uniref:Orotate phosphoribosyltransferase n=1 Tax=Azospirillum oleiclasticum TaxID=2735135 RepID=A0ABX2THA1_9PROT|nr:orotate phosphoribosyltransferase [Azospirillum oleiclasticum]NYZ16239.1 orotate phosphoribosyltransferase [Azospirillum oleiclasticum]NYZ23726.1 orotate phosphoribosyltransferase [Azospirillum oleiclasticum]